MSEQASHLDTLRKPFRQFGLFAAALGVCFAWPLRGFIPFAFKSELFSHVFLVPAISAYLIWLQRERIPAQARPAFGAAALWALTGLAALGARVLLEARGVRLAVDDVYALTVFSFVCLLLGGAAVTLGGARVRALVFPLGFLFFLVPFPVVVTGWIETFFQRGSAEASDWLFRLAGVSYLREGQIFRLPGLALEVASECSGIRSSLVLFITCLLAGHLFLRTSWRRAALAAAVVPLGILRNAFRIFTLAMATIHVDPNALDSPLHNHGGPVFFVLSLGPLFFLLWLLRRTERNNSDTRARNGVTSGAQ